MEKRGQQQRGPGVSYCGRRWVNANLPRTEMDDADHNKKFLYSCIRWTSCGRAYYKNNVVQSVCVTPFIKEPLCFYSILLICPSVFIKFTIFSIAFVYHTRITGISVTQVKCWEKAINSFSSKDTQGEKCKYTIQLHHIGTIQLHLKEIIIIN